MTISHDADDLARRMRVIDAVLGGGQVRTIALLGEGSDHVAYEVNGTFIARLSTHPGDAVAAIEREVQVLGLVRPVSPIPVPEVAPTTPTQGVLVLRKLPGTSLLDEPCKNPDVLVDQLAALLSSLHDVPAARLDGVERDVYPLGSYLSDAADDLARIAVVLPQAWTERFGISSPSNAARSSNSMASCWVRSPSYTRRSSGNCSRSASTRRSPAGHGAGTGVDRRGGAHRRPSRRLRRRQAEPPGHQARACLADLVDDQAGVDDAGDQSGEG